MIKMIKTSLLRVVILNAHYPHYEMEKETLAPFHTEVEHIHVGDDPLELIQAVRYADALMVRETPINVDTINAMENCKVIVRYGVGVDNIDLMAAKEKGIYVANVPNYGSDEVAEHAFALLMAVSRRIVSRDKAVRNGLWNIGAKEPIYSLKGKTLGIIGFGRIGRAFHSKTSGLGFAKTLMYDPSISMSLQDVECVDLETLCAESDVISLHVPLTTETFHLIDSSKLSLMKQNVILVNTSRGGLIDETALVDILESGKIFGVGLDVFETEPPNLSHPLFKLDNVVVTDHTGWYSEESLHDLQKKAAQEVVRVFLGNPPNSWVNSWEE
jgi:D-3-phosphoglycerate dehydrogenase